MASALLAAADARLVFVVGKGGVGKTTTACALALGHADAGRDTLLLSTDPAHSTADVLDVAPGAGRDALCGTRLMLEEFDARAYADRWTARVAPDLVALVEGGTYLDTEDTQRFLDLLLPGIDEVMAALRLTDHVPRHARTVVDTAPTGHALRLLGSAAVIRSWAEALAAMAAKARAVGSALAGHRIDVAGQRLVDELRERADRWERDVLRGAGAVIVTRADAVVTAETWRLADALDRFGVRRAAFVCVAADAGAAARLDLPAAPRFAVPAGAAPAPGCDPLRGWLAAAAGVDAVKPVAPAGPAAVAGHGTDDDAGGAPATAVTAWLDAHSPELFLFAGKGGVGKSTCAAAVALQLARTRPVLLYSTDPAGSLGDVLGVDVGAAPVQVAPGLRARQLDAAAALAELREAYQREVTEVFDSIGIGGDAALDRRVALAVWDMAPPGIDEIAALVGILEGGADGETLVMDAAPTGHFLRLLQLPALALDWTHALMRVLLKYRMAGTLDTLAERLLALARQLRTLQATLPAPGRTGAFVVTLAEPIVAAESARLGGALVAAGIPVVGTIVNRSRGAQAVARGRTIVAPPLDPPPVGAGRLHDFLREWEFAA